MKIMKNFNFISLRNFPSFIEYNLKLKLLFSQMRTILWLFGVSVVTHFTMVVWLNGREITRDVHYANAIGSCHEFLEHFEIFLPLPFIFLSKASSNGTYRFLWSLKYEPFSLSICCVRIRSRLWDIFKIVYLTDLLIILIYLLYIWTHCCFITSFILCVPST